MADEVDSQSPINRLVTAPVLIGNVGTEEWHQVLPKLIKGGDTGRGTLAHTQNSGLLSVGAGRGALREGVLNEIGNYLPFLMSIYFLLSLCCFVSPGYHLHTIVVP